MGGGIDDNSKISTKISTNEQYYHEIIYTSLNRSCGQEIHIKIHCIVGTVISTPQNQITVYPTALHVSVQGVQRFQPLCLQKAWVSGLAHGPLRSPSLSA